MAYFFSKLLRLFSSKVTVSDPKQGILESLREWHANRTYVDTIGEHKREIIVDELEKTCASLKEAREAFENALVHFDNLVFIKIAGMEHKYYQLNKQYQTCHSKSETFHKKIKAVKKVSQALFIEWDHELNVYSSPVLRESSKQQLTLSKANYTQLINALQRTESKIWPILASFHDQALYLKHHLNARAITALKYEFISIAVDISELIDSMDQAIAESNLFVAALVDQLEDDHEFWDDEDEDETIAEDQPIVSVLIDNHQQTEDKEALPDNRL